MMGRHPYTSDLGEEVVAGLSGLGKTVGGRGVRSTCAYSLVHSLR